MKRKIIKINIQSYVDVITNSSTELYILKNNSKDKIIELLNSIIPDWRDYFYLDNIYEVSKYVIEEIAESDSYFKRNSVLFSNEFVHSLNFEKESESVNKLTDQELRLLRGQMISKYGNSLYFLIEKHDNSYPEDSHSTKLKLMQLDSGNLFIDQERMENYWDALYKNNENNIEKI